MTIMITALLATVVVEYNYEANFNLDIANNYKDKLKASYLAQSGLTFAKLYLSADDAQDLMGEYLEEITPLLHGKPIPLGEGYVTVNLDEEDGKINLNKILVSYSVRDAFLNLLDDNNIDTAVYASLVDWIDLDDDVFENGAEDIYYQTLEHPYPCKNGPLESIEELKLVKGVDEELFNKLKGAVTIYSEGLINVNTASKEVLMSLSENMREYDAEQIIERRNENKFEDINELNFLGDRFNEIKNGITVGNTSYKIVATGVVNEISYKITNYVSTRGSQVKLLYAKEI